MTVTAVRVRRRAAGTALLLLLTGGILGILVDRLWLTPAAGSPPPLTADALADRLGLSQDDESRLRALLDTLNADALEALGQGPDSLLAVTHAAHMRIEAVLPGEARPAFHAWMQEQHRQVMARKHEMHSGSGETDRGGQDGR